MCMIYKYTLISLPKIQFILRGGEKRNASINTDQSLREPLQCIITKDRRKNDYTFNVKKAGEKSHQALLCVAVKKHSNTVKCNL